MSNIPKDVLNNINKKSGKKISENAVKRLAGTVTPDTISNEQQLRQLIMQVSRMANVPVSEATIQDIIRAVKKSGVNHASLESLMKVMMGKK